MRARNPENRDRVVSLFLRGLTYSQIARSTGITLSTVKRHLEAWRRDGEQSEAVRRQPVRIVEGAEDARQIEADRRFVRALALAFGRGDHLSKAQINDAA